MRREAGSSFPAHPGTRFPSGLRLGLPEGCAQGNFSASSGDLDTPGGPSPHLEKFPEPRVSLERLSLCTANTTAPAKTLRASPAGLEGAKLKLCPRRCIHPPREGLTDHSREICPTRRGWLVRKGRTPPDPSPPTPSILLGSGEFTDRASRTLLSWCSDQGRDTLHTQAQVFTIPARLQGLRSEALRATLLQ